MSIKFRYLVISMVILLWGTSACGVLSFDLETKTPDFVQQGEGTSSADAKDDQLSIKETPVPSVEPTSTPVEEPEYSFEPVTYHDDESEFELLYPSIWTTPGGQVIGSRGYNVSFFEGDVVRMGATVYLWDPKRNLEAWSEQREFAWTSSGTILSKTEWILEGEQVALAYIIESVAGEETFFMLTTIGERYFELAGSGDLELLREIARTVRIPEFDPPPPIADDLDCRTVTDETPLEWVACNIRDGIKSRNLAALLSWMKDPFGLGYWQSEWTEVTPEYMIDALSRYQLPSDASSPMAFTIDSEQFPPLFGQSPYQMMHPDVNLALVMYSEGWGEDGNGAALIFIAEDEVGEFYWHALLVAPGHFDK